MEKPVFTEEDALFLTELESRKMSRIKLILFYILIFIFYLIASPLGIFTFTLFIFLIPAILNFFITGISFNLWLIMLGSHLVFYELYLKEKYYRDLLPDFYVMKEALKILKRRIIIKILI